MTELPRAVRVRVLLRSLAIQGSWNYQTLIGTGFAFVLLPALRHIFHDDPAGLDAAARRHAELFNSHPYLATLAAGAVVRLEAEQLDPRVLERFKSALRGSLGSLGDQLVWWAWRPTVSLLGLGLLLVGAPWWLAVGTFLVAYNLLHLWLRGWGLEVGIGAGLDVGKVLRNVPLQTVGHRVADWGAGLGGFATVVALGQARMDATGLALAATGLAAGLWLGLSARSALWAAITTVWVLGILFGTSLGLLP